MLVRVASEERHRQRTAETMDRVVSAGLDVLVETGWSGLTMSAVARAADVSVGLVYKRFEDKDDLVFALHEAFLDRVTRDWADRDLLATGPVPTRLRHNVREFVTFLRGHEPLLRAFMTRSVRDARVAEKASDFTRSVSRDFKDALLTGVAVEHPSPEVAADVCFRMVYDVAARRIVHGPRFEADLELQWDRLTTELADACAGYLCCPREVLDA